MSHFCQRFRVIVTQMAPPSYLIWDAKAQAKALIPPEPLAQGVRFESQHMCS